MGVANLENIPEETWLQSLAEQGRAFTNTNPRWRHNTINLASLGLLLSVFPLAYFTLRGLPAVLGLPILGLVYGSLIFSLFTLVVHEASHNQFLIVHSPRLRRRLNDVFGWAVCVCFVRNYEGHWRRGHLLHHRQPLVDDDPQNCAKYVLEGRQLLTKLVKVWLIPFYEIEAYRLWMRDLDDRCPKPEGSTAPKAWVRGAAFVGAWGTILFFPLRAAPMATLITTLIAFKTATTLNFLKSSLEHGGGYRTIGDRRLRTRGLIFPLKSLCFPFCVTPYHWEHHLVPDIPWYRLPRYRRTIAHQIPEDRRDWIYTPGPELLRRVLLP